MRYLPLTPNDRQQMLAAIGAGSIDELFADVPPSARREGLVDLPLAQGELEVERAIARMAAKNTPAGSVPSTATVCKTRCALMRAASAVTSPCSPIVNQRERPCLLR